MDTAGHRCVMITGLQTAPGRRWFYGLTVVLTLIGCREPLPAPEPTRGVILISLDTLAADHLSAYGYERETSPFLDSLAARGTLFENAIVQYPSTLVSHVSMFTGLYPQEHGVLPFSSRRLSAAIDTLPERFAHHGFRTAGHTEGGYVSRDFGFERGFDEFADPNTTRRRRRHPRPRARFPEIPRFRRALLPLPPYLLDPRSL